jgi:hypothetical protein
MVYIEHFIIKKRKKQHKVRGKTPIPYSNDVLKKLQTTKIRGGGGFFRRKKSPRKAYKKHV